MKSLGLLLLPVVAFVLLSGPKAGAQNVGDQSVYFVTYYSNAHTHAAPDQTVRIVNDGDSVGNLWASFYVFDDSEEMQECCSCAVTPDGLTSESVNRNLTARSLTGRENQSGVIKVISSSVAAAGPANFTNNPTPGLRLWSTHTQSDANTGAFYKTEAPASDANLVSSEKTMLETLCFYVYLLGGDGPGICSCTPEGAEF